jgi:hypothetical protein
LAGEVSRRHYDQFIWIFLPGEQPRNSKVGERRPRSDCEPEAARAAVPTGIKTRVALRMIAVTEFISRFEQGYTEAFLCRGEDGHPYVVKSRRSGKAALIREWVCGRIGRELGLPIPPFEFICTTRAVAAYSANEDLAALADTPGFGSRFVGGQSDGMPVGLPSLNVSDVPAVDPALRRLVLLFDWWILNVDRTEDNPNLLWDPAEGKLHVFDHNLAFDRNPADFWSRHIFRADRSALSDAIRRAGDFTAMDAILRQFPQIWSEMPESWTEVSDPAAGDVDTILRRCTTDDFWCPQ